MQKRELADTYTSSHLGEDLDPRFFLIGEDVDLTILDGHLVDQLVINEDIEEVDIYESDEEDDPIQDPDDDDEEQDDIET